MALLGATLLTGSPPVVEASQGSNADFRMFTLGYKQSFANAASYGSFRASIETRFEQISPLLSPTRPNVVLLPEDTALTAWTIGARGTQARLAGNTAVSAIASLAATYAPQVDYYAAKCRVPGPRALVLALSDTTWRAFGETLSDLAKTYGVYVFANANIGLVSRVTDPGLVALLGDPQAGADYAYEAGCDAYNAAFVFGPDGEVFAEDGTMPVGTEGAQIRGFVPKAYLVPIERDQTTGLALSSADPSSVKPVDLGFASFGVFTSKDAWMSDLPNRNDIDGADVFVQPEAGPWAGWNDTGVQDWQQDAMHRAIWGFVQKLPNIRYGGLTNLIGNFHDLPFDGTPTITSDAQLFRVHKKGGPDERHYLLGRDVTDGIVARSEWVVVDPGPGIAFTDIDGRRDFLQSAGEERAPGGAEEDLYREDAFVWADIYLPPEGPRRPRTSAGPFTASTPINPTEFPQWEPSLAGHRGDLVIAWTDLRNGAEDALVSRFFEGVWSEPVDAGPDTLTTDDQTDNQYGAVVAIEPLGKVRVAWADFRNQSWDIRGSSAPLESLDFEADERIDHSESSAEGFPAENVDNDPAIVATTTGSVVAWDDLRERQPDRDVRTASTTGAAWNGDGSPTGTDNADQFHPSLSFHGGRVWIAWQSHRTGDPNILVARANDPAAQSFGRAVRADDGPADSAAFHPQIAVGREGSLVVWSDDRSGRYQVRAALGSSTGFGTSIAAGRGSRDQTYPALARLAPNKWLVAWTDMRTGDADIVGTVLTASDGLLKTRRAFRIDDSGPADARMASIAVSAGNVWVAWEDLRTGAEQIHVSSTPLRALR